MINELGLDESKVLGTVKQHLFEGDYLKQEDGLIKGLKAGGIKKLDGKKLKKSELRKLLETCREHDKQAVDDWLTQNGVKK